MPPATQPAGHSAVGTWRLGQPAPSGSRLEQAERTAGGRRHAGEPAHAPVGQQRPEQAPELARRPHAARAVVGREQQTAADSANSRQANVVDGAGRQQEPAAVAADGSRAGDEPARAACQPQRTACAARKHRRLSRSPHARHRQQLCLRDPTGQSGPTPSPRVALHLCEC
eukprot:340465-Rhodomonas_salina.2